MIRLKNKILNIFSYKEGLKTAYFLLLPLIILTLCATNIFYTSYIFLITIIAYFGNFITLKKSIEIFTNNELTNKPIVYILYSLALLILITLITTQTNYNLTIIFFINLLYINLIKLSSYIKKPYSTLFIIITMLIILFFIGFELLQIAKI